MPSAEELRELGNRKNAMDKFLEVATFEVKAAAGFGNKSITIDAPPSIKPDVARFYLMKTFPDCTITKNLFSPHIKIKWG
jgi:hypothetical protein